MDFPEPYQPAVLILSRDKHKAELIRTEANKVGINQCEVFNPKSQSPEVCMSRLPFFHDLNAEKSALLVFIDKAIALQEADASTRLSALYQSFKKLLKQNSSQLIMVLLGDGVKVRHQEYIKAQVKTENYNEGPKASRLPVLGLDEGDSSDDKVENRLETIFKLFQSALEWLVQNLTLPSHKC